jgi:iron complex outermembrane receptor protein
VPQSAYQYTVPGVFAQDDLDLTRWLAISASGRLDGHSQYGTFFSPRLSALVRSGRWNSRLSVGTGFFAPTPLTEETEAAGLSRLTIPQPLKAERGQSASFDFSRTDGPVTYTATLFGSRIRNPVKVDVTDAYVMRNLLEPTTNIGAELLATLRRGTFSGTATYMYVRSRERDGAEHLDVPLTPRHSVGLIGIWASEDIGRLGLEWYYTGQQRLEANPYRQVSRPYMLFGALVEKRFGHTRLFVNGENFGNVKQTHWDPLLRPTHGVDGRWTVDAWAPLDGRNINGGVRVQF